MEGRFYSIVFHYSTLFKQVIPTFGICNRSVVLSYRILGDPTEAAEPPIFIFHGLLGNKKQWEGIGKIMVNMTKRAVIAVDLRNHGDSPHINSHKYEDHATDILYLFKKLGVTQASLIGHCMGGKAAMCLALTAPFRVTGVLVVDISPASTSKLYEVEFLKILEAMDAVDFKTPRKERHAQNEAMKQLKAVVPDDYLLRGIVSNIRLKTDATIGWTVNIETLMKHMKYIASFPENLKKKKYYGPTLFIGGQLSEFIPPDDLTEIRRFFPKAVITYIPKTGHNVHIDDPRSFLELAISFITTNHFKRSTIP